nr:hypothetical protein [uncultured Rhodopila sp.]
MPTEAELRAAVEESARDLAAGRTVPLADVLCRSVTPLHPLLIVVFQYVLETGMPKKLTITVDAEVYDGLHTVIGRRRISRFLNDLARPHVVGHDLSAGYAAMAADEAREAEADAWSEALLAEVADEPKRDH